MLGRAKPQGLGVHSLNAHQVTGEVPLAALVEGAVDHAVAGFSRRLHALGQKRHHALLDPLEEGVVEGAARAVLVLVQPDVIGVCVRVHRVCHAHAGSHEAVEVGLEACPVVCRLSATPDVVGLDGKAAECSTLVCGHANERVAVTLQDLDLGGARLANDAGVGLEPVEQRANLWRAEQARCLLAEDRRGLCALLGGLGGIDGGTKGCYLVQCVAKGEAPALEPVKIRHVLLGIGKRRIHRGGRVVGHDASRLPRRGTRIDCKDNECSPWLWAPRARAGGRCAHVDGCCWDRPFLRYEPCIATMVVG